MPSDPIELDPPTAEHLAQAGLEFLAEFLATATERDPENVDALSELGHVLTRLGRLDEGLVVDRRLVRLLPDNPTAHYNLACSYALVGLGDQALESLERSVERGYCDVRHLETDEDLTSLHADARFQELVRRLREAGAASV